MIEHHDAADFAPGRVERALLWAAAHKHLTLLVSAQGLEPWTY